MAIVLYVLIELIQLAAWVLSLAVLVDVIISYFVSPYNSFRMMLDRFVGIFLNPIRRVVPPLGMIDLSPIVLLIIIQVVESLLVQVLRLL